jgi:hypothetical protein
MGESRNARKRKSYAKKLALLFTKTAQDIANSLDQEAVHASEVHELKSALKNHTQPKPSKQVTFADIPVIT